jgi:BioD-like phosphotransacetylase family protein
VPTIYIAGASSGAGTTAVTTGIATLLAKKGVAVTLIKAGHVGSSTNLDADAAFHNTLFPTNAPPVGWPVAIEHDANATVLDGIARNLKEVALPAGLTLVEGVSGNISDSERHTIDATLAEALDARVILVSSYAAASPAQVAQVFGNRLIGTIVNSVPDHGKHVAETVLVAAFLAQDIQVLGLLPENRRMLAPTVADVAEHLGADVINRNGLTSPDTQLRELVEHFMLGGLFLDKGAYVFGRRENKAVIVRGDRPDLQMAALDTSTVCLILTNNKPPVQYITHHAQLRQVPMLAVSAPTMETMEKLHSIGDRVSVHSAHKSQCFAELLETHCDLESLTALAAI